MVDKGWKADTIIFDEFVGKFDPNDEMWKIKEELNELIDGTNGKDKEMYQEIMEFAKFVETKMEKKNETN